MIWTTAFDMSEWERENVRLYMAIVFCHAHHLRFEGYLCDEIPLNVYSMLSMNLSLSFVRVCALYKCTILSRKHNWNWIFTMLCEKVVCVWKLYSWEINFLVRISWWKFSLECV